MTTIVGSAAGGNWNTNGAWVGGIQPTAADDVRLSAASGNITINVSVAARSLDCTGYTGTLIHSSTVNLSLGDATPGTGNVSLKLSAGMTYSLGSAATSRILFVSTSATQQTITTAGKTLGSISFTGSGCSYILTEALTIGATSTFVMTAGTFNTGNFAWSIGLFSSTGAGIRTLTLGSSVVTVTGNSNISIQHTGSNLTVTANTSVITFTGASAGFNMNSVSMNGASVIFASTVVTTARAVLSTVVNCTYNGPAATGAVFVHTNLTVTGTLTITGASVAIGRILVQASTFATSTILTAAAVSFTNVDFQDTDASGASVPWTGTSMGDALGNTDIVFDTPVAQTRTGVGGNWSNAAQWTTRVPLPQDDVIVGAAATGTLAMDLPRLGRNVDFTGHLGTPNWSGGAGIGKTIFGSLVLGAGMTMFGSGAITFGGRGSHTIRSNGKAFLQPLTFAAVGGSYTLVDALGTNSVLTITDGTFDTANFAVTSSTFVAASGRATTINLGTSVVMLVTSVANTVVNVNQAATVFNASTATFALGVVNTGTRTFTFGNGRTIGTITYAIAGSTGTMVILGSGTTTIGTLNFSDANNARSLQFGAGATYAITNWNVNGTPGNLVTVGSSTAANHTLTKPSGIISSDYLSISRSQAGGGAGWYAGANSVDGGNNAGWIFTAALINAIADFSIPPITASGIATSAVSALSALVLNTLQLFAYGMSLAEGGSAIFLSIPVVDSTAVSLTSANVELDLSSLILESSVTVLPFRDAVVDITIPMLELMSTADTLPPEVHDWLSALAGSVETFWTTSQIETFWSVDLVETFWGVDEIQTFGFAGPVTTHEEG